MVDSTSSSHIKSGSSEAKDWICMTTECVGDPLRMVSQQRQLGIKIRPPAIKNVIIFIQSPLVYQLLSGRRAMRGVLLNHVEEMLRVSNTGVKGGKEVLSR